MKKWTLILLAPAFAGVIYLGLSQAERQNGGTDAPLEREADPPPPKTPISGDVLTDRLVASGWPREAAGAVVKLNLDRFELFHTEAEAALEYELRQYEALEPEGRLGALLENHPELAGVALMISNTDDLADGILDAGSPEKTTLLINSFVKYTDGGEMEGWAAAVKKHGRCISGLLQRCAAWPVDALFTTPADTPAGAPKEFDRWLNEVFSPDALPVDDEEAISLIEFALAAGPEIRRLMVENADFRGRFNDAIWPAFTRCVSASSGECGHRAPWELFATTPELWRLLMRQDGEALFTRCGLMAAELLYGAPDVAVPAELREKCAQLLLCGNQELVAVGLLGKWKDWPEFHRLVLNRNLSDAQILTCCHRLSEAPDFAPVLLGWNKLSDRALANDIGPPPGALVAAIPGFAVFHAAKKLAQGRGIGWTDAIGIGGDALTIFTLGASVVALESAKAGGKVLVTKTLTEGGKKLAREAVGKGALDDVAKLAGKEIAKGAAQRELVPWTAHQALRTLPKTMSEQLLKSGMVDITDLTRAGFKVGGNFGLGRASVKRLTGLEARLFMRSDARVIVNLPAAVAGTNPAAGFLNQTAVNLAIDQSAHAAVPAVTTSVKAAELARQNIACWWAALATRSLPENPPAP